MNGAIFRLVGILAVLIFLPSLAGSEMVVGPARVIDGDTIDIGGRHIRLHGIDAPESRQTCTDHQGRTYRCGEAATNELDRLIQGQPVTCTGDETGRYGRLIAICRSGSVDLNQAMVRAGWAVAFTKYSEDYLNEELEAAKAQRGLWGGGPFMRPEVYRHRRWAATEQQSPEGCPIKGNISANGRIYHMPWSRWYARTRIDIAKGERWFCSEAEAIEAGWRASRR